MYRVSFTGYRPQKLPFFAEDDPLCVELKARLTAQIEKLIESGASEFFSGMALGVDIWSAEAVLSMKERHPHIKLIAVLPCRGQEVKWNSADQLRYREVLNRCDKVICISEKYTNDCMMKRNRALVELCDLLIAVYDGKPGGTKHTVDYAAKCRKKTIVIPPL